MSACYCTGECRSNPCHPCNGGIAGKPERQGWLCTKCGASLSPVYLWCPFCRASETASPPTYPRRIRITCDTSRPMTPYTQEDIDRMLEAAREQLAKDDE